jgi:hypothetical protein
MPVRVMLSQLTSAEITELRAYHELLREESQPKQDDDADAASNTGRGRGNRARAAVETQMTDPEARYRITAKDDSASAWRSAVSNADKGAKQIKGVLAASFGGLAIGTLFVSQISKAIEFGDEIGKLKTKLGTTAEATSELVAVAKQFDIEIGRSIDEPAQDAGLDLRGVER